MIKVYIKSNYETASEEDCTSVTMSLEGSEDNPLKTFVVGDIVQHVENEKLYKILSLNHKHQRDEGFWDRCVVYASIDEPHKEYSRTHAGFCRRFVKVNESI